MSYCDRCDACEAELADYKAGLAAAQIRVKELEGITRDFAERAWKSAGMLGRAEGHLEGLLWGVRALLAIVPPEHSKQAADLHTQTDRIEALAEALKAKS